MQPTGNDVSEPRPFVFLDFAGENTTVAVTSLKVDGEDVLSSLEQTGSNRFLYWPAALEYWRTHGLSLKREMLRTTNLAHRPNGRSRSLHEMHSCSTSRLVGTRFRSRPILSIAP